MLPTRMAIFPSMQQLRRLLTTRAKAFYDPLQPYLPLELSPKPAPIKSASFVKSSTSVKHLPEEAGPEFAFVGQSNVGKSSLLNRIVDAADLAKVSKRPGKTTCINHFLINQRFFLVDLPGYGHAQASKSNQVAWHAMTKAYFLQRRTLAHVFLLVDSTQPPQRIDVDAALWLSSYHIPYTLLFTKVDLSSHRHARGDPGESTAVEEEGLADMAATVPTFCNAVQVLGERQQRELRDHRQRAQEGFGGAAACSRFAAALPTLSSAGKQPPFYLATSAMTGLNREVLLRYLSELSACFTKPIRFRK